MNCSRCSFDEILETDKFCIRCGARLLPMDDKQDSLLMTQRVMQAAEIHYRLGNVYFRKGDLDQAISSWTQALSIDPGLEPARQMLDKVRSFKPRK
jgi:tetratricopeptide (TPR) repeat protein